MSISDIKPEESVKTVYFTKDTLSVDLSDGRTITAPLAWYPRLLHATQSQLKNWEVCGSILVDKDSPLGRPVQKKPETGKVIALPRVGGLHHRYEWQKAAQGNCNYSTSNLIGLLILDFGL